MPPPRTLAAPEHQPFIIVDKSAAYADRFDFIGTIIESKPKAYITLTPADCHARDIKDARKK